MISETEFHDPLLSFINNLLIEIRRDENFEATIEHQEFPEAKVHLTLESSVNLLKKVACIYISEIKWQPDDRTSPKYPRAP